MDQKKYHRGEENGSYGHEVGGMFGKRLRQCASCSQESEVKQCTGKWLTDRRLGDAEKGRMIWKQKRIMRITFFIRNVDTLYREFLLKMSFFKFLNHEWSLKKYMMQKKIYSLSWKYKPSKKCSQIIDFPNSISYYTNPGPNSGKEWNKLKLRFSQL